MYRFTFQIAHNIFFYGVSYQDKTVHHLAVFFRKLLLDKAAIDFVMETWKRIIDQHRTNMTQGALWLQQGAFVTSNSAASKLDECDSSLEPNPICPAPDVLLLLLLEPLQILSTAFAMSSSLKDSE